jgi:cytochrome b involved in lipid metabolism
MLKKQTGRKGKDAWTVLGGRVYNISPYLPFHPGGEPELLRGAGRDGTRLFGEIHPWVNYEGMLAACLVGIYVPEEEGGAGAGGGDGAVGGDLEAMD